MNLSDLKNLEARLAAEIADAEALLAKKRHRIEFVRELIEEEKQQSAQGDFAKKLLNRGDFVLTRAAVEARSNLDTFTKKDLEAQVLILYPSAIFSSKSLDRIIHEWWKADKIERLQEANGIIGAVYKNLSRPPQAENGDTTPSLKVPRQIPDRTH